MYKNQCLKMTVNQISLKMCLVGGITTKTETMPADSETEIWLYILSGMYALRAHRVEKQKH